MNRRPLLLLAAAIVVVIAIIGLWPGKDQDEPPAADGSAAADSYVEAMGRQHEGDTPQASEAAKQPPTAAVEHETVSYGSVNGEDFNGYLAHPAGVEGALPALVMYHEWWGLNDNIRAMADRLAAHGYLVLAADFYDGKVYDTRTGAQQAMNAALNDKARLAANIYAAFDYIKSKGAPQVGVIGWCFGGSMAFQNVLLTPAGLDAAVIYYGQVGGDAEKLAPIQSPILAFFGGRDESIPPKVIESFESTMHDLDKSLEVHVYADAGHGFANPSGKAYEKKAAEDAWARTLAFLQAHMSPGGDEASASPAAPDDNPG